MPMDESDVGGSHDPPDPDRTHPEHENAPRTRERTQNRMERALAHRLRFPSRGDANPGKQAGGDTAATGGTRHDEAHPPVQPAAPPIEQAAGTAVEQPPAPVTRREARRLAAAQGPEQDHDRPGRPGSDQLAVLRTAGAMLDDAADRREVTQIGADSCRELVLADRTAMVVRSVPAPRLGAQSGPPDGPPWPPHLLAVTLQAGGTVRQQFQDEAVIAVPVICAGRVAAALLARRSGDRPFSDADEDAMLRLARITGVAFDAVSRLGQPGTAHDIDHGTGLPTRDRLLADLRGALRTTAEAGPPLSAMILGVDPAPMLHQAVGPKATAELLAAVAGVLRPTLRVGDMLYRWGECELAALMPGVGPDEVAIAGERMSASVEAARIPTGHPETPVRPGSPSAPPAPAERPPRNSSRRRPCWPWSGPAGGAGIGHPRETGLSE